MRDDESDVIFSSLAPWMLWALIIVLGLVLYFSVGTQVQPVAAPPTTQGSP